MEGIKVLDAALHDQDGQVVLRGQIHPECLALLLTDDYQREVLRPVASSRGKPSPIKQAVVAGAWLPDVVLGMRGQRFQTHKGIIYLEDPVFIIDGLQRISTVRGFNELNPDAPTKTQIGALIHFGTTKEFEKEMFAQLNTSRTPMSPNVLLRNMRDAYKSILTLYGLCHNEKEFVLYGRVSWQQNAARGQLMSALILARVAASLHKHIPSINSKGDKDRGLISGGGGANAPRMAQQLENTIMSPGLGLKHLRDNIRTFFETVDECFGLRAIEYRELAVQTKGNFLITLAAVMSAHSNFWKDGAGQVLSVDADMKKRLKNFAIHDPGVERLAGAGNAVMPILFNLMVDHLNKGRSRNRLQERK